MVNVYCFFSDNVWLAAVPPCVGFAGWLLGGMDSKPLFCDFYYCY
jgi:hypothetical protein